MPDVSPTDVRIRLAHRADVPAIIQLLADDVLGATREQPGEPLAQAYWDAFDAMNAQSGNELYVADLGGEIVGCVQLSVIPGLSHMGMTRGLIEGVRVSSRHRGKRIGEVMIRAAVDRARTLGCRAVQLTTNRTRVDAQRFYERLGFEATHVGMKLTLS